MVLNLDGEDGRFLMEQLTRRLQALEVELAHTDNRAMHEALEVDVTRLQRIVKTMTAYSDK